MQVTHNMNYKKRVIEMIKDEESNILNVCIYISCYIMAIGGFICLMLYMIERQDHGKTQRQISENTVLNNHQRVKNSVNLKP